MLVFSTFDLRIQFQTSLELCPQIRRSFITQTPMLYSKDDTHGQVDLTHIVSGSRSIHTRVTLYLNLEPSDQLKPSWREEYRPKMT